jgi:hypothetical protein
MHRSLVSNTQVTVEVDNWSVHHRVACVELSVKPISYSNTNFLRKFNVHRTLAYLRCSPPLKTNIGEVIQATCDMLEHMIDDFTKSLHECIIVEGWGIYCILFSKVISICIKLNFQDFCYMLMCQLILFTQ